MNWLIRIVPIGFGLTIILVAFGVAMRGRNIPPPNLPDFHMPEARERCEESVLYNGKPLLVDGTPVSRLCSKTFAVSCPPACGLYQQLVQLPPGVRMTP